ncbi:MAG: cytochrome c biogenesis protein CcsA [Deltaproteobacteria bacterium]|nr:cytochrome c biogenesis protein CcsA [Deltaproteobacteria bacterium]
MQENGLDAAIWILWCGVACCAGATAVALRNRRESSLHAPLLLAWLAGGTACFGFAIAERWLRLGYGPFTTLFEILLSNLFSLGAVYSVAYWRVPAVRPGAIVALPILLILGIWALIAPAHGSHLPPTYHNPWLWVHVGMGKLFLSICLVATGLAGFLLLRRSGIVGNDRSGENVWNDEQLDQTAWRFLALAFVFHSLMLISGAVWAQDAWGRYWAWDPLETWAFATWLFAAMTLHGRVTFRMPAPLGWCLILGVFILAFLTFFGVPFVSLSPHKGAI